MGLNAVADCVIKRPLGVLADSDSNRRPVTTKLAAILILRRVVDSLASARLGSLLRQADCCDLDVACYVADLLFLVKY
jgi:hypothetical protein